MKDRALIQWIAAGIFAVNATLAGYMISVNNNLNTKSIEDAEFKGFVKANIIELHNSINEIKEDDK
jgi:hypothetical protein